MTRWTLPRGTTVASLRSRIGELEARWRSLQGDGHDALQLADLLPDASEQLPAVIEWLVDSLEANRPVPANWDSWLRDLARRTHQQGLCVDDVLDGFQGLFDTILEAAVTELDSVDAGVADGARLAAGFYRSAGRFSAAVASAHVMETSESQQDEMERIEQFVRTLTHEMKGALHASSLAVSLLCGGLLRDPSPAAERAIAGLKQNLMRIDALVRDCVELATDTGGKDRRCRWASLKVLTAEVLDEFLPLAEDRDVYLHRDPGIPDIVVDAGRVALILRNLLANAIKYSDANKPKRWVRISAFQEPGDTAWCVRVEDNGIGIEEDKQQRMFSPFWRGSQEGPDGSGVGLSISKKAADQLNATLSVSSKSRVGTAFTLRLASGSFHSPDSIPPSSRSEPRRR